MKNARVIKSLLLAFVIIITTASPQALAIPIWQSWPSVDLDESMVPFAEYDYIEYENAAGAHLFDEDIASNPIISIQACPPRHLPAWDTEFVWDSNPGASDYGVWLNDNGSAEFVWQRGGIYALQIHRQTGDPVIQFILADCFFAGWARRKLSTPQYYDQFPTNADIIIVGKEGNTSNDRLAQEATEAIGADKVVRVTTAEEAKQAIISLQQQLGRKVKVVLAGHGEEGKIIFGDELDSSEYINKLDTKWADDIQGLVSEIGIVSCSTGAGADGQAFLDMLKQRTGADSTWAYDQDIATYWYLNPLYKNAFWIMDSGHLVFGVPEPATLSLLALGGLTLFRRRQ